jgi:hypothetical protein
MSEDDRLYAELFGEIDERRAAVSASTGRVLGGGSWGQR